MHKQVKDQMKTLEYLRPVVKIDSTNVYNDPLILFTRLIAILQRETDSLENFDYELTSEPAFLSKEGIMRKLERLDKAESYNDIITK